MSQEGMHICSGLQHPGIKTKGRDRAPISSPASSTVLMTPRRVVTDQVVEAAKDRRQRAF